MSPRAEIAIVGGGTAGLACAWSLAEAGHAVTVLERFGHVHEHGSHGGATRAIRHAYHEGPHYLELVDRADALWVALERGRTGQLLRRVGLLEFGAPDDPEFAVARAGLASLDAPHEHLDAAQLRRRFGFRVHDDWIGTLCPHDGYLAVRPCLDALRDAAAAAGASFRHGVRVREVDPGHPRVLLESGELLRPDVVVVCAGAFVQDLLPWLRSAGGRHLVRAHRRTLHWRAPTPQAVACECAPDELPVWAAFCPEGFFYGFPTTDVGPPGLKLACHAARAEPLASRMRDPIDPDAPSPPVGDDERAPIDAFIDGHFPLAGGAELHTSTCKYASTVSGDFIVDRVPGRGEVFVAGGLSGHGFKFAPVLGELVRDLVAGKDVPAAAPFGLRRHRGFGDSGPAGLE